MASIGRKEPVSPAQKPRPVSPSPSAANPNSRVTKVRGNLRDIAAELNKVTWPTREEARNLTIAVVGIAVFLAALLGTFDAILSSIYRVLNP
ncbi:MAG: preprotein translocase subunit SecE [Chloroflexota bacterium]|nr:preprotein translocase subunit SecE [Chloroflexota bacterium]